MKKKQDQIIWLLLLVAGCMLVVQLQSSLQENAILASFSEKITGSDAFRAMEIGEEALDIGEKVAADYDRSRSAVLVSMFFDGDFSLAVLPDFMKKTENVLKGLQEKEKRKPEELKMLSDAMDAVWADVRYFPVPESSITDKAKVSYENSWMWERTYGGKRGHEGTDLMASINERGRYPVVSMTDGVVENIGWLPKGGYRIGIRSPHGGYFYYAHLASYAKKFVQGDQIQAGELLGLMGDTGYSDVPGTTGNFDVHLHLGIYIKTPDQEELSINPYYVLKSAETKKLIYQY